MSMFVDARPIQEAKGATLQLLPYTLMLSVLFALIFSYFYSRKITRPIKEMEKGTAMMQNLVSAESFIDGILKVKTFGRIEFVLTDDTSA